MDRADEILVEVVCGDAGGQASRRITLRAENLSKIYREDSDGRPELESDPNIAEAVRKGDLSRIAGIPQAVVPDR